MDLWLQIVIGISVGTACGSFIWVLFNILKDGVLSGILMYVKAKKETVTKIYCQNSNTQHLAELLRADYETITRKCDELKIRVDKLDPKTSFMCSDNNEGKDD